MNDLTWNENLVRRNMYDEALLIQNAPNVRGIRHSQTEWMRKSINFRPGNPAYDLFQWRINDLSEVYATYELSAWSEAVSEAEVKAVSYTFGNNSAFVIQTWDAVFRSHLDWYEKEFLVPHLGHAFESGYDSYLQVNRAGRVIAQRWPNLPDDFAGLSEPVRVGDLFDFYWFNGKVITVPQGVTPTWLQETEKHG